MKTRAEPKREDSKGSRRPRILLADDDADHRHILSLVLGRRLGRIVVDSLDDGHDALVAARRRPPDLAILDYDMPGLDGLHLALALRAQPNLARLPIVVVSGRLGAKERELLSRAGVDRCFDKPVVLANLAQAVCDLMAVSPERITGAFPRVLGALDEVG